MLNTMKEAGLTVVNVGDAVAPRNLHAAVREGATAGLLIDEHQLVNPNNTCINDVPIDIAAQLLR